MRWIKIAEDKSNIPTGKYLLFCFNRGYGWLLKYCVGKWDSERRWIVGNSADYKIDNVTHFSEIENPAPDDVKRIKKITITEGAISNKVEIEYEYE